MTWVRTIPAAGTCSGVMHGGRGCEGRSESTQPLISTASNSILKSQDFGIFFLDLPSILT